MKPDKELQFLIDKFVDLRKQKKKMQEQVDKLEEQESSIEDTLCSVMLSKGLKSIKQTDGIMVIAGQKHEFFIKPESKDGFFKHLKTTGDEGLITTSVNYQVLQGFMNGLLKKVQAGSKEETKKLDNLKKYLDERTRNRITVKGLN